MLNVHIYEAGRDGRIWHSRHRTNDEDEAIRRALKKHFGRGAGFFYDSGLRALGRYGQVTEWLPSANAYTTLTDRAQIVID